MKITILTLFPEMFTNFLETSIIKKARLQGHVTFDIINIRDFADNKWNRVDTPPVGGGAGMILQAEPIVKALESVDPGHKMLLSPRGNVLTNMKATALSQKEHLIFVCGHYEGIDERVNHFIDEEISIGDYILTGGELGAMVISDAVIRLLDEVISTESLDVESFDYHLLEYPQYTEPYDFRGYTVPTILYSGNHAAIRKWRLKESLRITRERRPDLFKKITKDNEIKKLLKEIDDDVIGEWEKDAIEKGSRFTKNKT
ncbi:MAG: tRNA (guanine-N(1)-)-methyltransferase [Tenericutes bacterium ADurb.Bin087]|nr:MAG: tRNA (guanine-N(1)-)-methyltransferase [Tenericutes bacterium ADurb.Bin087]